MGEQHGLGRLDVGRARQDGLALALGEADERALERRAVAASRRSIARRVQSRRSVATWSLRERPVCSLPATGPIRVGQRRLEVEVDVLERRVPRRTCRPRRPRRAPVRPADELVDLVVGQEAGAAQAADVGDGAREVVGRQLAIDARSSA